MDLFSSVSNAAFLFTIVVIVIFFIVPASRRRGFQEALELSYGTVGA